MTIILDTVLQLKFLQTYILALDLLPSSSVMEGSWSTGVISRCLFQSLDTNRNAKQSKHVLSIPITVESASYALLVTDGFNPLSWWIQFHFWWVLTYFFHS